MRYLLAEALRERRYDVTTVATGEAALRSYREQPFELVLVDWTLPGISGLDVCRVIRAEPGGEDVVLLVITGRDRPEDLSAVLDAGASDYVAKPFDPDLLRTRLMVAEREAHEAARRRESQEKLRASEAAFRALIEGSPDSVLVSREGVCVYGNPRAASYLGYPVDSIPGIRLETLFHPEERAERGARSKDCLDVGKMTPAKEMRMLRADGAVVVGECIDMPLMYAGEPATITVIRDLTERKQMQSQLLLADRMASVGTLAAGVAHELNNPLAYVLNNLRLTREELQRQSAEPELLREQIDEAIHGAERMGHIVADLKTFSRIGDERTDLVELGDTLQSSINMCWNEIRHRAELIKELGETPPVEINESRLGQVFLNVLINAAQAMPEDRLEDNRIKVRSYTSEDGWAVVEISDTGCGISEEHLNRIFDPFFTTKDISEGTGLGLAICHNIVKRVGGRISVDSEPGRGTTFRLTFPPGKRAVTKPMVRPSRTSHGPKAKVLVVDDEQLVGRSIRRALRGHEVQVLSNGNDAITTLCNGTAPDVVFCDLMMPEVSGMDVFEAVRSRCPELVDRFVFMTGGAFTPKARQFLESTTNVCVEKPFDLARIRDLVRERSQPSS